MNCSHEWRGSGPCPDCSSERVTDDLFRDVAALCSIGAAARSLLMFGTAFTPAELAGLAYDFADEMLARRKLRTRDTEPPPASKEPPPSCNATLHGQLCGLDIGHGGPHSFNRYWGEEP